MSELKTTDKDGLILEEYNGKYSLISARVGNDGKLYKQFATYQIGRDKHADKDWPVKISLGDPSEAREVVLWLADQFGVNVEGGSRNEDTGPLPADDVPF